MAAGVLRSHAGVQQPLSDYRIVLLGHRSSGKTSVGSSILGSDSATAVGRTLRCVQREGEAAGRRVALVEAPGWWKNYSVSDTSELTRREIQLSAALCPPGPHAFLLVVRLDAPFTEKHRRVAEEHVGLLGERAWHYTIVLFTYNDRLEDDLIEQHIGSDREAQHQRLVERCQKRCHVLNVDKRGASPQVVGLLEKIDEMMVGSNGQCYEGEGVRWEEWVERRSIKAVRAEERMAGQEPQEEARPGQRGHLSKMRLLLLGSRRAGKSSACNTILGRRCSRPGRTTQCALSQGEAAQRQVTVVDTPGWWRGVSAADTPELTKREVALAASLCPPGPHAILLVHRADFSFGDEELKAWEEHVELLLGGGGAWAHALVLFTHGDWLGERSSSQQYVKAEGEALRRLVEKCGGRSHILDNSVSCADGSQVAELLEKVEGIVGARGSHYMQDRARTRSLEKGKLAALKRPVRRAKQQRQCGRTKSFKGDSVQLSTLRIVLLGYNQSGKTSAGNAILGAEAFDMKHTTSCARRHGEVSGQQFTVIDTPGWHKSTPAAGTPVWTRQEMMRAASLCPPGPHVLLLAVRADASFGEDEGRSAREHLELLGGERIWSHTLVLFTCADWLGGDATIEQHVESEGQPLRELLDRCGNRYHALGNKTNANGAAASGQVARLLEKVKGLVLLNSGGHFNAASLRSEGEGDGEEVDSGEDRHRRKDMLEWNWTRQDVSDEPRRQAEGRVHRSTRNTSSWFHTEEAIQPAETPRPSDCQEMSEEDGSDDVFLEDSSTERCPLLLLVYGSLTPTVLSSEI
ncbi:GTPase IMAP family member 8-like [Alosa sapidissima]|uniref:GTPase IMAP family member 8-like n=1 Tax=Alosa sapidissima TaxID=34773 RepID=UPI001C09AE6E|nr:GTPase IMAP family member 8-like [Alosa sapidissima]